MKIIKLIIKIVSFINREFNMNRSTFLKALITNIMQLCKKQSSFRIKHYKNETLSKFPPTFSRFKTFRNRIKSESASLNFHESFFSDPSVTLFHKQP